MNQLKDFIFRSEFDNLKQRLDEIQNEIGKSSFNIFSVSTNNSHRENFHSDILALLLNPTGKHEAKNTYLYLFFDFLVNKYGISINKEYYKNVEVKIEEPTDSLDLKGRIDILVADKKSCHCIIIENKMNNAGDTIMQLEKYYTHIVNQSYIVDAIVYLPLNESKKAPFTDNSNINSLIFNVPAFSNKVNDLYHGWLLPCYKMGVNESANSFIFEYTKL